VSLGPLSITNAAIDGLYSAATALELASMDEDMTGKFRDCNNCALRDSCNGICQFAPESQKEAYD